MSKVNSDQPIIWLHKLCYGGPGSATTRRRDIRKFNGFSFDLIAPEFDRKKALAMKCKNSEVNIMFFYFCLEVYN